jgi:hypothetical protein
MQDNDLEKIALIYDHAGRELYKTMFKQAAPLPPGLFSGKKGLAKLLGIGAGGTGAYAYGKYKGKKEGEADDVQLANVAYRKGINDGARALLSRIRQQMGGA